MTRRALLLLLSLALALGCAGPAAAGGSGPYEPFPEEDPKRRAADTVQRLNDRLLPSGAPALSPEQLERGVVVRSKRRKGRGAVLAAQAASQDPPGNAGGLFGRAGVQGPADGSAIGGGWLLALALALALAAAAFELRAVRQHPSP
jgi:hypothetical protein